MIRLTKLLLLLMFMIPSMAIAEEAYWEYTFRPDDSIWKIAEKYTTSVNNWYEIQKINRIRQGFDRKIQPGTRIVIPITMLKLQPTPAIVIAINGDVDVIRKKTIKSKVSIGEKLYSGDRIVTADKQNIRIQFADGSELQIQSNSQVSFDKLSHHKDAGMVDTRIHLNSGSINTKVKKQGVDSRYEIKTPAAVTSVRGTSFRMSSDKQFSRTEVTEGVVGVAANKTEKEVKDGYGIVAEKGKPLPEPIKLLDPPVVDVNLSDNIVSWQQIKGSAHYHYKIALDKYFNNIIANETTKSLSFNLVDIDVGHYYLSVRGVDQHQLEGVDSINEFEIQPVVEEEDDALQIILFVAMIVLFL